jgi:serine phosphatase RsbU (regulator of sigma subunit)
MPAELPAIAGFAASALYRPAGTTLVGGDFYDAFRTPRGWALIVGDIAGQGVKAAALTAQARHVLRANTMLSGDLVQAVTHLNRVLCAEPVLSLCTICAVLLPDDLDSQATEILCAGHPRPILVRDGDTRELGDWGPMVGAFSDSTFTAASHALAAGDLLVLYTDGLLDARGASGRFGGERLRRVLAGVDDPVAATGAIREALADFEQGAQADDTAVVAFKRVA